MTVSINGHTYEMGRKEFNKFVNNLKKSLKKKPMIIAIEKNGHVEMRNDVYKNQRELTNAIVDWNKRGFQVKYTRGV